MTYRELCARALQELGAIGVGETPSAADLTLALGKLNDIFDNWNADRKAVYAETFPVFTFVPSLSPQTIGPTGVWVTPQRPVSVEGAKIDIGNGVFGPSVSIEDAAWWQSVTTPTLETDIPVYLYYDPTWPNGELYFWPVPESAYQVQLRVRYVLAEVGADDLVSLPPGYRNAIVLTLAEDLSAPFRIPVEATTAQKAREARARIFANNQVPRRIITADLGLYQRGGTYVNWMNREIF